MIRILAGLSLAATLALPLLPVPNSWLTLADYAGLSAIVTLGLVVLTGFGGMTSFGQATFMAFGAYATALLTTQAGWSPWLALPVSLLAAGLGAALIGALTLRLSGHYLALATIAWSVSFFYLFGNLDALGRNDGISGLPPLQIGSVVLSDSRSFYPVVWIAVALALLGTRNLLDSRVGRAIRALRGGGTAASFGVRLTATRMLAFVYAAVLAGLAGWLYAHMQRSVNPSPFGLNASIEYLLMAVLGGVATLPGALLGAGVVTVVNDRLQDILPRLLGTQGNYETIVFGVLLVWMLQTSPEGLWPRLRRSRPLRSPIAGAGSASLPSRALPAAGSPVLVATGLRKTFGGLVAVDDFSLGLDGATIVGLIGPNGAGKSTLFDLLTGVAKPTAGRIEFLGQRLNGFSPAAAARLGLARSFQHVKLVPGMSALENVALGAHLRGKSGAIAALLRLDRAEERRLFAEARRQLTRLGLAEHAGKPADSLALGQQRLVEIARALCLDPVLLLLDEPAAGLRHAEKLELAACLRGLQAQGMTILVVEHDMNFMMNLADRLVVVNFGTKLAEGRPAEIRSNPAVLQAYLGAAV